MILLGGEKRVLNPNVSTDVKEFDTRSGQCARCKFRSVSFVYPSLNCNPFPELKSREEIARQIDETIT